MGFPYQDGGGQCNYQTVHQQQSVIVPVQCSFHAGPCTCLQGRGTWNGRGGAGGGEEVIGIPKSSRPMPVTQLVNDAVAAQHASSF